MSDVPDVPQGATPARRTAGRRTTTRTAGPSLTEGGGRPVDDQPRDVDQGRPGDTDTKVTDTPAVAPMRAFANARSKIRGFVLDELGQPIQGLTVALWGRHDQGVEQPLAVLTSDAAGYLSFAIPDTQPQLGYQLHLGTDQILDLNQVQPDSADLAFVKKLNQKPLQVATPLPSMQLPDLLDLHLSPRSFGNLPSTEIAGACSGSLSTSAAEREFNFTRVTLGPDQGPHLKVQPAERLTLVGQTPTIANNKRLPKGKVIALRQAWWYVGNSTGDIVYSVPLAPGETVQLATVEWRRSDALRREDQIGSREYLNHILTNDRTIEETVTAAVTESQQGFSLMGGASHASNGGGAVDLSSIIGFPLKLAGGTGDTAALGGAVAMTGGSRDVEVDAVQTLSNTVAQAATAIRSLNSTVVVQADQAEAGAAQTRIVTNHNRCHTMTVQYYEVLRTFRVETKLQHVDEVVFLPFATTIFSRLVILQFRTALERALLDRRLLAGFDAAARLTYAPDLYAKPPEPATTPASKYFTGRFTATVDAKVPFVSDKLIEAGSSVHVVASGNIKGKPDIGSGVTADGDVDAADWGYPAPGERRLSLVCRIGNAWHGAGTNKTFTASDEGLLTLQPNDYQLGDNSGSWDVTVNVTAPAKPDAPPPTPLAPPTADGKLKREDDSALASLLEAHIRANEAYYSRAVWLLMDPSERRDRLEVYLGNQPEVLSILDATPLAVLGRWVAFAVGRLPERPAVNETTLTAVPSRGVVAEAQLGRCNVCEKRDITRAMDWPIPVPPQIAPITVGPAGQTPPVPGQPQLPPSVVAITQAPAMPDPQTFAAALQVLGTKDLFRDMSGIQQVSALLEDLVAGSVSGAEAAMRAASAQGALASATRGGASGTGTGSQTGGGTGGSIESSPQQSPLERLANLQVAEEVARRADSLGWSKGTTAEKTGDIVYAKPNIAGNPSEPTRPTPGGESSFLLPPAPPALDPWVSLLRFTPPRGVAARLESFTPDSYVHKIEDAFGPVNLDWYPVRATLPAGTTPEAVLTEWRKNINRVVDTRMANFEPYDDDEARLWAGSSPIGAVLHIDMRSGAGWANPDDGSVVVAEAASDHWIFSTVWTLNDLAHPVSGNRWFGFIKNTDGSYTFGTRGADRTTGPIDWALSGVIFTSAHALWLSLQQGLSRLITSMGGTASIEQATSERYDWPAVQAAYGVP